MSLKVIGAGFPRTGTMSLKLALEELGFGPCHHMIEVFQNPEQPRLWARKFNGEALDWEEVLKGYNSLTDAPGCFAYRELADRYPEAKVILGIRSPESWWKSASSTVMSQATQERMSQSPGAAPMLEMFQAMSAYLGRLHGAQSSWEGMSADRETASAAFERHNESVREYIAPERLLVFEATQGWEPLCGFLWRACPGQALSACQHDGRFQRWTPATASRQLAKHAAHKLKVSARTNPSVPETS